ncbi:metal ABC transporter ATP-binding protein [Enterococcus bulliens]
MIELNDISVRYRKDEFAVDHVSLSIATPALIGILGPNGAGKSTLIKGILQLVPATGQAKIDQQAITALRQYIAYVEQKAEIDRTFPITVRECVSLGLYPNRPFYKKISKSEWQKVDQALAKVEMESFSLRQIGELSGGQFQRVLVARALVQQAKVIFLDEPFVGIDRNSEELIMNVLRQLRDQGTYIFIVHHDLGKVNDYFDEVILMNKRLITYGKTKDVFIPKWITKTYGTQTMILQEGSS